ncbi:hypothetical protein SAMN05421855_1176 [Ulvibacter litoralis]|uniref:Uncharacterized protein n=2 Tax=Ulvibacter litoralis TaxID=227084 RepID=A0A1G7JLB0_9FLAO|nr:hypothetical protein GCM10008083_33240 [Ulvibacter litoralis]SDF25574.1 hypothetical protein SAMN05421855_1176 [Ulvibacter litoralis]
MNPELDSIIDLSIRYDTLFLFVLIIGIYEMLTKPSWFKTFIRILLICIVLSYNFLGFIPIEDFRSGIYNVAWFSAFVALVLILFQLVKYGIRKTND